ncbi:hypothetical protein JDW15_10255 [Aerococcaceae bacterium zg-ZJ1578]|uniref:hypothetical protein n=1 Tax=Aerococcaceae bacterium zg-252 TaxID=2796928 RepID=UPI001A1DEBFE|nr:hypothetical protein [Aerococcaceae bacterium zg-1578]
MNVETKLAIKIAELELSKAHLEVQFERLLKENQELSKQIDELTAPTKEEEKEDVQEEL